ncbi:MAG: GatB/YqeY domain-containing protein [Bacillota bacterium]
MSLKERLLEDMKTAMKAKDKQKLSVIRMARAAIKNVEIAKRKDLDDNEVIEVLAREVKQRRDSISEFEKAGKEQTVLNLNKEIEILTGYLPEQLSEEKIEKLVYDTIKDLKDASIADIGKVMGIIMPKLKGRADGRLVNTIVRKKLS